jgi:hypothetical protein
MKKWIFSALAVFALFASAFVSLSKAQQDDADNTIHIVKAYYGRNCTSDPKYDLTKEMRDDCDGKKTCSFGRIGAHGDGCPNQNKDFDWSWSCSKQAGHKDGHIDGPAEQGVADASCPLPR